MLKSALVLGPSGIGKAHLRVLANFGVKNIYLKGKNFKSNRLDFLGLNKNSKTNFHNLKSLNKLKKKSSSFFNLHTCGETFESLTLFEKNL